MKPIIRLKIPKHCQGCKEFTYFKLVQTIPFPCCQVWSEPKFLCWSCLRRMRGRYRYVCDGFSRSQEEWLHIKSKGRLGRLDLRPMS